MTNGELAAVLDWGLPPDVEAQRKKMTTIFLKEVIRKILSQFVELLALDIATNN
jgi:hypothetical protein